MFPLSNGQVTILGAKVSCEILGEEIKLQFPDIEIEYIDMMSEQGEK